MALTNKTSQNQSLVRFLVRQAGLTGLLAAIIGLVLWFSIGLDVAGPIVFWTGVGLVALALLFEIKGLYDLASSRRGAVGANVLVQVLLAVLLVVGLNIFSFFHYQRWDWTRDGIFTINQDIRNQLAKLQGQTDIIVYQRHRFFGQTGENKEDHYDSAAERKIIEKVKDLAEQFQELGPRFRVQVLDSQDEDFQDKLKDIKKQSPALAEAIEKAPENSIFFHSQDKVQRLAFHDVYQLDREASRKANDGQGNLVLNYQGLEPFARKVLNVEEKQPRVAVGVVHPVLGLNEDFVDYYTLNGAKKTLEAHDIATVDFIMKKGWEIRRPEAAIYTFDENQFESLDEQRASLEETIKALRQRLKTVSAIVNHLKNYSLEKLNEEYIHVRLRGQPFLSFMSRKSYLELKKAGQVSETSDVDDKDRQRELKFFEDQANLLQISLEQREPDLESVRKQLKDLKVEELEEKRRIPDLRVKMNRVLSDCDLVVLPRLTLIDIPRENVIPYSIHKLQEAQFAALRDFLKAGKPVLFCLGSANEPPDEPSPDANDPVDKTLEELGFKLPRQTILFNSEVKAFGQRRGNFLVAGSAKVDIPPVQFDWKQGLALSGKLGHLPAEQPNPVRESIKFTSRNLAGNKDQKFEIRYPRPVYFTKTRWQPAHAAGLASLFSTPQAIWGAPAVWVEHNAPRLVDEAVFMVTDPAGWNEDQPFPTEKRLPQYEPPKPTDPGYGTLEERRQGSFPIAAATEVELPASWFPERTPEGWAASIVALASTSSPVSPLLATSALVPRKQEKIKTRLAVVGSGNVFTGKQLNPVQQKLLLDLTNWLLGRDDLLAKDRETWQYPRVQFSDTSYLLWQWGTRLGLPLAFVYFGLTIWMVRRMR